MQPLALPTFDLSLAAVGLRDADGGVPDIRWVLELARTAGYHAIQINAADPVTRPRELSRSARRDLAAHIRRHELTVSGVDLWIPNAHFSDESKLDRIVSAHLEAAQLAADLAELTAGDRLLCVSIPWQGAESVLSAVADCASRIGVSVANHAYPWPDALQAENPVLVGVDPPAVVLDRADPADAVSRASSAGLLRAVRLADLAASGRVPPGEGSLNTLAFRVAIATSRLTGFVTVDVRGLRAGDDASGQIAVVRELAAEFAHPRADT
jgi:sugar phosphate isomerase/epimerase